MYSGFMIDDERIVGLKVSIICPTEVCFVELNVHRICSQASQDGEMEDIDVFVL